MSSPDLLHTVHINVSQELIETIETTLELLELNVSHWHDKLTNETRFDIFFNSANEAANLADNLRKQLIQHADKDAWNISIEEMPNKKWQDSWKEFFHVERISEHIVIKPSHEEYTPAPGDCVINIDPGMSFGTGQHETTKACLQFLDKLNNMFRDGGIPAPPHPPKITSLEPGCPHPESELQRARSFLDLGCGSGILSIAAAQLGFSPIRALDIDPDSVRIAAENFNANNVQNSIEVAIGDVSKLELPKTYDLVTANILAPILLANAEQIASTVNKPDGILILAGILNEQYQEIATAYTALGFKEIEKITENEWTSGCFTRQ